MSQKWPSRGSKRTFLPLRDLSKGWAFHCKVGSARKTSLDFFEFSLYPYHTFLLHLIRSRVDSFIISQNTGLKITAYGSCRGGGGGDGGGNCGSMRRPRRRQRPQGGGGERGPGGGCSAAAMAVTVAVAAAMAPTSRGFAAEADAREDA